MDTLDESLLRDCIRQKARQQPVWTDPVQVHGVRATLAASPPLVRLADVLYLRRQLAQVTAGRAHVLQAGDCAEDPSDDSLTRVRGKQNLLDELATALRTVTDTPVLRVGRIAGQFAKPRSHPTEQCGNQILPVFRGHMVNGPEADVASRRPDPLRIITCYQAARDIIGHLGWPSCADAPAHESGEASTAMVWVSHEALLLDYELPMVRIWQDCRWLSSTHWPWIGDRTRQIDGAHVSLLAQVVNPIAVKIGPSMAPAELLRLCDRLDPQQEPGRLTLISRLGAAAVADRLPALVDAVRRAGHPVIWLCDPMHGNTVTGPLGRKTRVLSTVCQEVREFHRAVQAAGGVTGGLHLETTADDVLECVADLVAAQRLAEPYTTLCDPRLNRQQALAVVASWRS